MNLAQHLEEMAAEGDSLLRVVDELRQWPEATVSEGFSVRMMDALDREIVHERRENVRRSFAWFWQGHRPQWALAAAIVVLLSLVGTFFLKQGSTDGMQDDIAWIASVQEADGTWNPERHGGMAVYRPALTALSALALDRAPDGKYAKEIQKACGALSSAQLPSGAFGGQDRSEQYNHAITTFALASLVDRYPKYKSVLEKAVRFMAETQSAAGGWDYVAHSEGNSAVTAWNVRALEMAEMAGIDTAHVPLCKGLRWLRNVVRDGGRVAYHRDSPTNASESLAALTAFALLNSSVHYPELRPVGSLIVSKLSAKVPENSDCYRDYMKTLAFQATGAQENALVSSQNLRNNPVRDLRKDAWGMVGGHLYTSALTVLAQN